MIKAFVAAWLANLDAARKKFAAGHPASYEEVVRIVVEILYAASNEYPSPDPERIVEIDHGEYQGTLVYVIGCDGYQPGRYWYVLINYGSCSGDDTLQGIRDFAEGPPNDQQVADYMTLGLHIVQALRQM